MFVLNLCLKEFRNLQSPSTNTGGSLTFNPTPQGTLTFSATSSVSSVPQGTLTFTPTPTAQNALTSSSFSLPASEFQTPPSFPRDLKLGMQGEDVKTLQFFLNTHGFTVSQEGPGSPGSETNLFGSLTKQAVVRFQNHYKEDILTPNGLTKGTGMVGPATRKFIESLLTSNTETMKQSSNEPLESLTRNPQTELTRNLEEGMEGDDVRLLQTMLAKDKDLYPEGEVTGYFGPKTKEAVQRFQLKYQIITPHNILPMGMWGGRRGGS